MNYSKYLQYLIKVGVVLAGWLLSAYPMVIDTFLESYDFTGKTLVPFCTSASDDIDNSLHIFHELAPQATIAEALTANDEADIAPWLQRLGYR